MYYAHALCVYQIFVCITVFLQKHADNYIASYIVAMYICKADYNIHASILNS